jgi:F-type H+-transporting ATPase subunit b
MGDIAHALDLDLGIIVTQIIGFLLALWILKAFAWRPLLNMLDARKKKIVSDIEQAEKVKEEANTIFEDYKSKLRDIDAEARRRLHEAVSEGNRMAAEIKDSSRQEARQMLAKSKEELARDVQKAKVQFRDEIASMAVMAAEKIISAKLDKKEHEKLLEDFLGEVEK